MTVCDLKRNGNHWSVCLTVSAIDLCVCFYELYENFSVRTRMINMGNLTKG